MSDKEILTKIKQLKTLCADVDTYFQNENDYVQMVRWDVSALQQEKMRILQDIETVKKQLEDTRRQGQVLIEQAKQEAERIVDMAGKRNAESMSRLEKVKAFVTKHEKAEYLALKEGAVA